MLGTASSCPVGLGPSEASSPGRAVGSEVEVPQLPLTVAGGGLPLPHLGLVQKYGHARGSRRTGDRGPESEHTS